MNFAKILLALCIPATAMAAADGQAIDPRAKAVLDAMTLAYRSLHSLQQETVYSGGSANTSRLFFEKPNRINMEMVEPSVTGGLSSRRILCDGKNIYFYSQESNKYSTDKAPKKLSDLPLAAGTLELSALAGLDAAAPLLKQAKSVKLGEPVQIDGATNDVVVLDMSNEEKTGELRLYTAQTDHLLRRFEFESQVIAKPEPKPAQPATPLEPGELPLEPGNGSKPVKFSYENRVVANKDIPKDAFKWLQPPGASLSHGDPKAYKVQSKKGKPLFDGAGAPIDVNSPTEPLDLHNEAKKVYASDLYKKAQKQRKKQ